MRDIKSTVDELACLHVLIKGLPSSFNHIVETIDSAKNMSYEDACAMLLKKELSIKKGETDKNTHSAAYVFRGRGRGYGRGRGRGFYRDSNCGRGGFLPDTFICRNCGGRGHFQSVCLSAVKNQNQNQTNQQNQNQQNSQNQKKKIQFNNGCGGSQQYRGRSRNYQNWSNSANATDNEQIEQQDFYAFMVEHEQIVDLTDSSDDQSEYLFRASTDQENFNENHIQWIMDTGTLTHIVCYEAQFNNYAKLSGSVTLPNGHKIRAFGVGNITFITYLNNDVPSQVTLKNVLYCPEFSINLMLLTVISKAGYNFIGYDNMCDNSIQILAD